METGGAIVINLFPEGCRHKAKPDGPTPFFFPPLLLPLPHEVEIRAAFAPNQWLWLFLSGGWLSPFGTLPRPVMWRRGSLGGHKKKEDEYRKPTKNMRVCTTPASSRAWGTEKVLIFGQGGQVRGRGQNFCSGLALRANRSAIV